MKMIKKLIKLVNKTKKANKLITKEQFLYSMTFEEQNKYILSNNMNFKEVMNNLN